MSSASLPVIDIGALRRGEPWGGASSLDRACRERGFFYVTGHGVPEQLLEVLERESRRYFALPADAKAAIAMERGGRAWRGAFPLGGELTSGLPDHKEGIYFGAELPPEDPRVRAGLPFHGPNLFPELPGFRAAVLATIAAMTELGHLLARALSRALGLSDGALGEALTAEPLVLFRIFRYPPQPPGARAWGVGEHTDYGLLTILHRSASRAGDDGLELREAGCWKPAPQVPGALLCNLGDMLERLTGGRWVSTPHRVRHRGSGDRLSFPFFFDPGYEAPLRPLIAPSNAADLAGRWDKADPSAFRGTYGAYLLSKVSKVFPELRRAAIDEA